MIRLVTLGGIDLRGPSGPLSGRIVQPRHLALLAVLARTPGAALTRGKLVGLLWAEVPERTARRRLSDTLYAIRKELGKEVVRSTAGRLRLDPDLVESDVADFEAALDRGDLEAAAEFYGGPFLDGFHLGETRSFDEWVDRERLALSRQYREALERLAGRTEEAGDWPSAVRWWRRRFAADPTDSRVTARLMQAMAASGNAPRAVAQFRIHEEALRRELGLPVSERLREMVESLTSAPPEGLDRGRPRDIPDEGDDSHSFSAQRPGRTAGPWAPADEAPRSDPPGELTSSGLSPEPVRPEAAPGHTLSRLLTLALAVTVLAVGGIWLLRDQGGEAVAGIPDAQAGVPPAALDHFEQGNAYLARRFSEDAVRAAIGQFEEATARDATFAAAWRSLIHARLWLVWVLDDPDQGDRARADLDQLLALDPRDPDVRMGKGWFLYYGERRYPEALEEFEAAAAARPHDPEILRVMGFLRQRLGRWDEAVSTLERAMELAPRDAELIFSAGQTLRLMGRPEEALERYEKAFSLVPEEDVGFLLSSVEHAHLALGDTARAREVRERARELSAGAWHGGRAEFYGNDPEAAAQRIRSLPAHSSNEQMFRLDALADAHDRMGDPAGRRLYADSLLELARSQAPDRVEGARGQAAALAWVFVGLAHIHLDRNHEGLQAVERGMALEASFHDALMAPFLAAPAARAYARAGEAERALDLLARVSRRPAIFSSTDLAMDPEWDSLRDHPRWPEIARSEFHPTEQLGVQGNDHRAGRHEDRPHRR